MKNKRMYTPKNVVITSVLQAQLDEAIARGALQREIGALLGVSENSMTEIGRKYINSRGQYRQWFEARKTQQELNEKNKQVRAEESNQTLNLLIPSLEALAAKKAHEGGFAVEKAYEYFCSLTPYRRSTDSLERYTTLYNE